MSLIKFDGSVSPAVHLSFRAGQSGGAHLEADENAVYVVANESLTNWDIACDTGSRVIHLTRAAAKGRRRFDETLNTYVNDPVQADDLNEIIDAATAKKLKAFITADVWHKTFFLRLLEWMTREAGDTHNIANPDKPEPIRSTFTHKRSGDLIKATFETGQQRLKDVPCELSGWDVKPGVKGRAPRVKFSVYMRIKEDLSADDRDRCARILLASDYSKIARYGNLSRATWYDDTTRPPRGFEVPLKVWETNVFNFLFNYTDISRGLQIRDAIVAVGKAAQAKGASQFELVQAVRDEIDKFLVTANAWHQPRESPTTEPLQHSLSEVFASLYTDWRASPVRMIREMSETIGKIRGGAAPEINWFDNVGYILQYGAAHCGEHAVISSDVLGKMMKDDPAVATKLVSIIHSGNSNIDHAFIVGGWVPPQIVKTTVRSPGNGRLEVGKKITVFDLRKTIATTGKDGYVCDPYLSTESIGQTGKALLEGLNNKKRRQSGKDTDFLAYSFIQPNTTIPEVTLSSVKNV